jgi:hypothetical protein
MRAEVTFFSGVIVRVDKDGIVRASSHAGLAPYTDRLVKINNAVGPLEHRGGGTGHDTRGMRALITARNLVRPPYLRKRTDLDVFDVGAGHRDGDKVF